MQTLDRNLLTPGAFKYNSITQKTAPGKWKKKNKPTLFLPQWQQTREQHWQVSCLGANENSWLPCQSKHSLLWQLWHQVPRTPPLKKKKRNPTNQPKKYVRGAQDTFLPSCADSSIQELSKWLSIETLDWRVDLLDKVNDCLTKKDGLLLSYRKFQSRIYISRTRAKESLWWQLILSNKTEWGKWPRFTISDLGSCVWCSN